MNSSWQGLNTSLQGLHPSLQLPWRNNMCRCYTGRHGLDGKNTTTRNCASDSHGSLDELTLLVPLYQDLVPSHAHLVPTQPNHLSWLVHWLTGGWCNARLQLRLQWGGASIILTRHR